MTLAISKQKGTNAVSVAESVLRAAEQLKNEVVPTGMELVITRNSGLTADEKVNELVDGLWVAILIVVALLTLEARLARGDDRRGRGAGGLRADAGGQPALRLHDQPSDIVCPDPVARACWWTTRSWTSRTSRDISRCAAGRRGTSCSRQWPRFVRRLISATLAVIVSFLPMFFITGMMGPYMAPMALNVPVAMLMSMVVAFTITPWMAYQVLRKKFNAGGHAGHDPSSRCDDIEAIRRTFLYRIFYPMMAPLLSSRLGRAVVSGVASLLLTAAAMGLAALRRPAQDAAVRQQERAAAGPRLRRRDDSGTGQRRGA